MGHSVTLGGDRLGSGKKQKVHLHGYERSTHDLGYLWRSSMSSGTIVPFLKKVCLPGDTWDIDLDCIVKTHPTIGPLFGSYKVQLDVFEAPIRLYIPKLHNNPSAYGLRMSDIKLPFITLTSTVPDPAEPYDRDNYQINPSSILAYLGIRGVGTSPAPFDRVFNAVPLLVYWDNVKNYYTNQQEQIGYVVHTPVPVPIMDIDTIQIDGNTLNQVPPGAPFPVLWAIGAEMTIAYTGTSPNLDTVLITEQFSGQQIALSQITNVVSDIAGLLTLELSSILYSTYYVGWNYQTGSQAPLIPIRIQEYLLGNLDLMRDSLLAAVLNPAAVELNSLDIEPYDLILDVNQPSLRSSQEGLAIKTYQSDRFNNWLETEWIDGAGGINEISQVSTVGNVFKIDALILARKVYDMLNRVAIAGNTYNDWQMAVYDHERYTECQTPMYHGGLIKELIFQEVVSNSESGDQALGTLAGKGVMSSKHKGGKITIKCQEIGYLMANVSLTPRIDYSQGNEWDMHLQTMDDFFKPGLDQIGFQDLPTEEMAWWSTNAVGAEWITPSAGKQTAWIHYQTSVNKVLGNFAIADNEMFMTLNRRYEQDETTGEIKDLTTYIDPAKYNNIFADTALDSQNFWVQIAVDATVRRKMSAKAIPNL